MKQSTRRSQLQLQQIDSKSSDQALREAADLLRCGRGEVVLEGAMILRTVAGALECAVIDPERGVHRCAEEFKVLIENASHLLAQSGLAGLLPAEPLRWVIVSERGPGREVLWRET